MFNYIYYIKITGNSVLYIKYHINFPLWLCINICNVQLASYVNNAKRQHTALHLQ